MPTKHSMASHFLLSLFACAIAAAPSFAADAKPKAPKKELTREEIAKLGGFEPAPEAGVPEEGGILADMLVVSVPDAAAVPLIELLKEPGSAEAGYRRLLGLIESKDARLISWPTVHFKSGVRTVIENITEVRYAIEFERLPAPNPPAKAAKGDDAAQGDANGNGDASKNVAEAPGSPEPLQFIPTSFETRNTGVMLELEAMSSQNGKEIDLTYSARHVLFLGMDPMMPGKDGNTDEITQPRFHANKVSSSVTMENGKRELIGVFRSGNAKDETEVFLLRVRTKPKKAK